MILGPIISRFLDEMVQHKASDMYLTVGCKPSIRMNNEITAIGDTPIRPADIAVLINELLDEDKRNEFKETFELNRSI